jgi:hypothetical protein
MTNQITIVFEHDSIWGTDPETWEGIDQSASEAELISQAAAAFAAAGVDAELVIQSSGATAESDYMGDDERNALQIANRVWEQHDWYVDAE